MSVSLTWLAIYKQHTACTLKEFSLERQNKKETHHFFLKSQALVSEDLDDSSKRFQIKSIHYFHSSSCIF